VPIFIFSFFTSYFSGLSFFYLPFFFLFESSVGVFSIDSFLGCSVLREYWNPSNDITGMRLMVIDGNA